MGDRQKGGEGRWVRGTGARERRGGKGERELRVPSVGGKNKGGGGSKKGTVVSGGASSGLWGGCGVVVRVRAGLGRGRGGD